MWKSSVGGLGEHEMRVMTTKGRARFVTHLGDRDGLDEEFLGREFGNFLEERMGVRLQEGDKMHTDGLLSTLKSLKNAVLPSKAVQERNAAAKAGAQAGVAVHDAEVAQGQMEAKLEEMKKLAAQKQESLKIAHAADERLHKVSSGERGS
jgi:hypothetical protein